MGKPTITGGPPARAERKEMLYRINYGKGRPGGNEEVKDFNSYRDAYIYAADNANGWGFSIDRAETSIATIICVDGEKITVSEKSLVDILNAAYKKTLDTWVHDKEFLEKCPDVDFVRTEYERADKLLSEIGSILYHVDP